MVRDVITSTCVTSKPIALLPLNFSKIPWVNYETVCSFSYCLGALCICCAKSQVTKTNFRRLNRCSASVYNCEPLFSAKIAELYIDTCKPYKAFSQEKFRSLIGREDSPSLPNPGLDETYCFALIFQIYSPK